MFDPKAAFNVGMTETLRKTVEREDTVGNFSPSLDQFLSTSACANTMIRMSTDMVDRFLPEGIIREQTKGDNRYGKYRLFTRPRPI